jgi:ribonuclease H / adenosylcobalamin/alpha-ribazole phosphatase
MAGRRLVVEADGGSRGNPGKAGYGALVRDPATGAVLAERAASVGIASNNVAEYSGLVAGLKAVLEIDPAAQVEVRMDSKLVVEQMSGRWKIKHEDMRRLALEAREVAADISAGGGSVRFTWIPRAENSAADALANAAMDGETITRRLDGDPVGQNGGDGGDGAGADRADAAAGLAVGTSPADPVGAPDLGRPTRLVLLRHGVTDFTMARKLDGRGGADPGLNALGQQQAAAAARAVRAFLGDGPVRVVSSSLARGVQTGSAVAAAMGVQLETDEDWDEQGFGDWDGKSVGQLAARYPSELARLREDDTYARVGGESHRDMAKRVLAAFERAGGSDLPVVVATHRKPIMVVLAHVLGIPHDRIWRLATSPASLTTVEMWSDGGAMVPFVNDTSHLR